MSLTVTPAAATVTLPGVPPKTAVSLVPAVDHAASADVENHVVLDWSHVPPPPPVPLLVWPGSQTKFLPVASGGAPNRAAKSKFSVKSFASDPAPVVRSAGPPWLSMYGEYVWT